MRLLESSVSWKSFWRKVDTERLLLYGTILILLVTLFVTRTPWGDGKPSRWTEVSSDIPDTLIGTYWENGFSHHYNGLNDEIISLPDLEGNYILLVFFDPHCEFCAQEAPLWQRIATRTWRDDIAVVGVVDRQSREDTAGFLKEHQLTIPVLVDADGAFARQLQVEVVPTKILLSRELRILQYWQGFSTSQMSMVEQGSLLTALGIPPSALPSFPQATNP